MHSPPEPDAEQILRCLSRHEVRELEAVYRPPASRNLPPQRSYVEAPGHNLLRTKFGFLDVLGTIGRQSSFEDLADLSVTIELDRGVTLRVLGIEAQIRIKEEVGRPKDLAAIPVLRQTLIERSKQGNR